MGSSGTASGISHNATMGAANATGARVRNAIPTSRPISSGRRRPNISASRNRLRISAIRWPVCHTPPRVVTHHTWVEKPSSTASARRSRQRVTPIRPGTHQARNTTTAARPALIPVSHWSAVTGPISATRGINKIAGKGANGT